MFGALLCGCSRCAVVQDMYQKLEIACRGVYTQGVSVLNIGDTTIVSSVCSVDRTPLVY